MRLWSSTGDRDQLLEAAERLVDSLEREERRAYRGHDDIPPPDEKLDETWQAWELMNL